MIKQGFISNPSTASFPPPNESTRSSHSNPTLLEMISDEQNRETRRSQDEPQKKPHARVAKILTNSKKSVELGDLQLSLVGRDGYRATMDVHKKVLSEKSKLFMEKIKSQSQSESHMVEISECDDVEVYVETVELMYCNDLMKKLVGENVIKILALLKVSSALMFEEGIKSCLEYLEAVPWSEDEEQTVVSCIENLNLPGTTATLVLQRLSSSTRITNHIFLKLLTGVLQAKDDKARREMKSVVFRLINEEDADHDVFKDTLYSMCHRCLLSLILCLTEFTSSRMNDPRDLIKEITREAGNLVWIVDILIEKKICDEFVKLWAEQKALANLHSKIPAMYRHEISNITARICVGIGKGRILVKRETRFSVLKTWLEAFYDDFGWMRRRASSSRSVDLKVMEDGLGQMILTLPLTQQEVILMKWFDRFMGDGDDECPNVQRAFEVWWRRAFISQVMVEPTDT